MNNKIIKTVVIGSLIGALSLTSLYAENNVTDSNTTTEDNTTITQRIKIALSEAEVKAESIIQDAKEKASSIIEEAKKKAKEFSN
ncbi:MAG: hypothetical protein JJV88_04025 [Sulfurovum sp.]|nr:hypothetical protein [Sulfurovaceae bacterium]